MARTVRNALLAAAAAGTLLAGGATTATAQASAEQEFPGNWLYVAVMQGEDAFGDVDGTMLRCGKGGRGGSHPEAAKACRQLARAGGDINKIPHRDTPCTMIYKPVTAAAYGMWNGRRVAYVKNFPNACVMGAHTGSVFKLS
ncbi:SSI family serine proteinase inhibitor [Streptomyces sp. NPDC041068]|uniref:SSI family serine proteinase inhibitor n=1 Tax=Streptomyces sp. NPDC041068 TaxID=3155130 RepID=UPI0033DB44C5